MDQILRPRPGFEPHLTNQVKKEDGSFDVRTYDLSVPEVRATLNELKFICKFIGKRFYICPDEQGICRNVFVKKKGGIFSKTKYEKQVTVMKMSESYALFLSGKLVCFSQEAYAWEMF